ncbi:MAG: adenine phosphoribosyltransferase [Aerococcus sp.]|nr:adenine phosphoribosyltransferase [Aerococcus sp.]
MDLYQHIASIPDYPEKGIIFRDITPLLADAAAFRYAIDQIAAYGKEMGADLVVGPEARGFIIGCPVAYALETGFVPVRKPGKLPRETKALDYGLEYGHDTLEIHVDAIQPGQKVLLVDDLLATGGTVKATKELVESFGGEVVGAAFVIELTALNARQKLAGLDILSLMHYDDAE